MVGVLIIKVVGLGGKGLLIHLNDLLDYVLNNVFYTAIVGFQSFVPLVVCVTFVALW
jgi:hypothetical protein